MSVFAVSLFVAGFGFKEALQGGEEGPGGKNIVTKPPGIGYSIANGGREDGNGRIV